MPCNFAISLPNDACNSERKECKRQRLAGLLSEMANLMTEV
jgi:hypothetical protein